MFNSLRVLIFRTKFIIARNQKLHNEISTVYKSAYRCFSGEEEDWLNQNGIRNREKTIPTPNHHIYLGNLPHDVTSKEIEDLLQVYGKVTDIKLHPEINVPRGTAFLKFQNQFIADQVAKLKEIEFRGRKISVNRAVLEKPKLAGGVDVYVKDVPRDITEGEVRQIFNDCGSILKVRFPTDRLGDPLNCVFVVFENIEQARAAANKNTMLYKGRNLQIKVAIDEKKLQDENSKIYVYGFPRKDTTETHLRAHFSGFGKILRVGMLSKGDSAKGDAVITFSNSKEAYAAINQADKRLLGHLLKIDLKKPKIIS